MPTLNLDTLTIKNFRSYGNYETELKLNELGPVLILGEKLNDQSKSNGAGKSSIGDAIIWCLFGRLPCKQRPADYVINWTTGKDCKVSIKTCDGYTITRTRNCDNHSDLLIHLPDGTDISDSTNDNAQQSLNKLFSLDYDIFSSNVFFAQFGMSFLELPDQKRKKAMERMLNLNKFDYYVEVAKEKTEELIKEQNIYLVETQTIEREINKLSQQVEESLKSKQYYEDQRDIKTKTQEDKLARTDIEFDQKLQTLKEQKKTAQEELKIINVFDLDKLKLEWDKYTDRISKLDLIQSKLDNIKNEIIRLTATKDSISENQHIYDPTTHNEITKKLENTNKELSKMQIINMDDLQKQWDIYDDKKDKLDKALILVNQKLLKINSDIEHISDNILAWKEKHGKTCIECKQEIKEDHIQTHCKTEQTKLDNLIKAQKQCGTDTQHIQNAMTKIVKPSVMISDGQLINTKYQSKQKEINMLTENINAIEKQRQELDIKKRERIKQVADITIEITNKEEYIKKKTSEILRLRETITPPDTSIKEAMSVKAQYDSKSNEIKTINASISELMSQKQNVKDAIREQIKQIKTEDNPYDKIIKQQKNNLNDTKKQFLTSKTKSDELDTNIRHLEYIKSAYSDRKKIKSFILENLIPFFNERISYYLNVMECSCQLKFTSALQTKYDQWPYEMWSGGERKKIDLALMFAIHDLHLSIYDQQCNMLVFDEIDGRLDEDGINKFVEVIFNELSKDNKRTILVISHKDQMRDVFPMKIIVKMDEHGFSRIEEVR